ncbi:hypothetical protein IWQ60_010833 [Tieghemiomyces parasiticus]|uniref:C2H2-type domain-containing protein n=1 Tax=Tieghemiomyces parasiticus TaxID=78921 RepID=A0A9W8DJ51_9FUNG|nr:hypothetical protein IWQ60_010833 [Tieghemiomyces parasiticus]
MHNLKSHAAVHEIDRPFQCDKCSHAFRRQHDLKRHMKGHTGERPFTCNRCGRAFARMDALNRHQRAENGHACNVSAKGARHPAGADGAVGDGMGYSDGDDGADGARSPPDSAPLPRPPGGLTVTTTRGQLSSGPQTARPDQSSWSAPVPRSPPQSLKRHRTDPHLEVALGRPRIQGPPDYPSPLSSDRASHQLHPHPPHPTLPYPPRPEAAGGGGNAGPSLYQPPPPLRRLSHLDHSPATTTAAGPRSAVEYPTTTLRSPVAYSRRPDGQPYSATRWSPPGAERGGLRHSLSGASDPHRASPARSGPPAYHPRLSGPLPPPPSRAYGDRPRLSSHPPPPPPSSAMTSWTPESSYAAELARTQEYVRRLEQDNERLRQDLQQLRAERSPAVNPYKRPSVGEGGSALSPYPPGLTRSPHAVPDHGAPPDISRYSLNSPYQPRTPVYPAPNGGAEPAMPSTSTYPRYGEPAYRASGSLDVPPTSSPAVAAVIAVEGPGADRPLGSERVILRRPSQLDIARLPPPTLPPIATAASGYPSGSAGYDTRQFPATTSSPARIPVSVQADICSGSPGFIWTPSVRNCRQFYSVSHRVRPARCRTIPCPGHPVASPFLRGLTRPLSSVVAHVAQPPASTIYPTSKSFAPSL